MELIKKIRCVNGKNYTNLYIRHEGHDYPIQAKEFGEQFKASTRACWVSLVAIAKNDKDND